MSDEKSAGLVIFRKKNKDIIFLLLNYGIGHWGFPKGNIETGESEKDTAIRETQEETGISEIIFIDNLMEKIEYFYRRKGKTIHKEVTYFFAETTGKEVILSFEHQEYKWQNFEEAMKSLDFENEMKVLRKANDLINKNYQEHN